MGSLISSLTTKLHSFCIAGFAPPPSPRPRPRPAAAAASHHLPHASMASQKKKYALIGDNFSSLDQVTIALREAGLETSNLIVGIDFTKSNQWTGTHSFGGQSLHSISSATSNPYEQAISIIGKTLSKFDDDNLIPCFGFGDVTTADRAVFSFYPNEAPCQGFEDVLARYKEIVPYIRLAGPTSFAPVIEVAMDVVEQSGGQYHILVIIADGQVTPSMNPSSRKLSSQEQATIDAIVQSSDYPLSIVLVGVGDGPWDTMQQFDDNIPQRTFDNFQFVNYTSIMSMNMDSARKEATFALRALMEIPTQYQATQELGLLNRRIGRQRRGTIKPPPGNIPQFHSIPAAAWPRVEEATSTATSSESQCCPVCLVNVKDMAFGCGHQTCQQCATSLDNCPLCRALITTRLRLFV